MRRVLTVLACAALVLTGCGTPRDPEVTFYAAGKTINIGPEGYCDVVGENCRELGETGELKVPPGKPLQISVPGALAEGRWRIRYIYLDSGTSQLVANQSDILGRGETFAFTLTLPGKNDQLTAVQVLQAGAALLDIGEPPTRGLWTLKVLPG